MSKKTGFTLIELLVVIAILGLLVSIVLVSLGHARSNARDARRIAETRQIANSLESYYLDKGNYPAYFTNDTAVNFENMITELESEGYLSIGSQSNKFSIKNILGNYVFAFAAVGANIKFIDPLYPDRQYEYYGGSSVYRIRTLLENINNPILSSGVSGPFSGLETEGENACDASLGYYCIGVGLPVAP